ncbi:MAG TPA: hypothetical protein VJR29_03825 [bacterium]|nr:hypothetical protein [bacterium]
MYQFTQMFGDLGVKVTRKSYRWWGLAAGILAGWLPAWGAARWLGGGGWTLAGVWLAMLPAGYYLGKLIKR